MMTNQTTIEVAVNDLKPGMFVSKLDRPWLETPYLIQGILIQSPDDIEKLKRYCTHVYVDIDRSEPSVIRQCIPHAVLNVPADITNKPNSSGSKEAESLGTLLQRVKTYTDICAAEQEIPAATKA